MLRDAIRLAAPLSPVGLALQQLRYGQIRPQPSTCAGYLQSKKNSVEPCAERSYRRLLASGGPLLPTSTADPITRVRRALQTPSSYSPWRTSNPHDDGVGLFMSKHTRHPTNTASTPHDMARSRGSPQIGCCAARSLVTAATYCSGWSTRHAAPAAALPVRRDPFQKGAEFLNNSPYLLSIWHDCEVHLQSLGLRRQGDLQVSRIWHSASAAN